jgi:dipeptidyl aminopeptidase/acylaminoacyl peptidase
MRSVLIPALAAACLAAQRPLEFKDIIEQREPSSVRISPDGSRVAYVVRQSSLATNGSKTTLWIAAPSSPPRQLIEESFIGSLEWIPDGSALSASLPRPGKAALWRVPLDGSAPSPLFEHPTRPGVYAWSPDGSKLLFTSSDDLTAEQRAAPDRDGLLYDERIHGIRNFTSRNWVRPNPPRLCLWRRGTEAAQPLDGALPAGVAVFSMAWSPAGDRVAIAYPSPSGSGENIGILTLEPLSFAPRVTTDVFNRRPQWRPSGNSLVFASTGDPDRTYVVKGRHLVLPAAGGAPREAPMQGDWFFLNGAVFDQSGENLLFEYEDRSTSNLYRYPASGGTPRKVISDPGHFSSFHFSADKTRAACLRQSITEPPEVTLVDVSTGRFQALTKLNPEFDSIRLQPAAERRWRNRLGNETNGFLILPPGSDHPKGLPLVILFYAFSNQFTTQAQWIASYPVQHLAASGEAVLLLNYPRELGWKPGDFAGASLSQAENPLASIEAAVESLVKEGLADPKRLGIAGWSFGAYLVEYTMTHSTLFAAASAGEGGLNNPGQYWVTGSASMQTYLDNFFGGPPFGDAAPNYKRLSPAWNADKLQAPLLREYGGDVGVQSLEFYMAARRLGKPVEQFIYPGAPHVFSLPTHRRASMERNLDWFRFWLQGYEDPDESKRPQYVRWRALRKLVSE